MARTARGGREPDPLNPFSGRPGLYNRINGLLFRFTGPAAVGIGRPEAPYQPPEDPACPVCTRPMREHAIDRTGTRTQLYCPTDADVAPSPAPAPAPAPE